MKVYLIEKLIDECAYTTELVCETLEIAKKELDKLIKKNKVSERFRILGTKLIQDKIKYYVQ